VFKILIHLDVVEDLLFYHYPREEFLADGKMSWKEFVWQYGRPDGDLEEEEFHPQTRYCGPTGDQRWHTREDDDGDREHKRSRECGFICRMSS
jgi:hypothetical protein